MKKRMLAAVLAVFVLVPMLMPLVSADSGPKPSTIITVPGAEEPMVLTLLGDREQHGPYIAVQPGEEPGSWIGDDPDQTGAWYALRDYADPDGFVFYGELWEGQVRWTYWPPETFKIAVYYPQRELLWVSAETYERYAFRSNYRLILPAPGENAVSGEADMVLRREHNWFTELGGLVFRILLTLAVELALAGLFGFNSPRQRKCILLTNLVTQVGLNVLLWVWYFYDGALAALIRLFLAELVVLAVELVVYLRRLREGEGSGRTAVYTICANVISVVVGFLLLS